jgi:HD superfamily phosphohydrolase YqeK
MADLGILHAKPLATLLEKEFYVDSESIADAIRRRQSFNVIHLDTMFSI